MEIGTESPAIVIEPAEDPFEVETPNEVEAPADPVKVPEKVPA